MKKILSFIILGIPLLFLSSCNIRLISKPITSPVASTALPTAEDVIRNFTNLINNGKIDDATNMLGPALNPDENSKQAWTNNFNDIKSINLKIIEPWEKDSWTTNKEVYKTVLEVQLKVGSAAYGWANGDNTKWIEINKSISPWKIDNIATGP